MKKTNKNAKPNIAIMVIKNAKTIFSMFSSDSDSFFISFSHCNVLVYSFKSMWYEIFFGVRTPRLGNGDIFRMLHFLPYII